MSQAHLTVAPNGRLVIPASMRAEIGLLRGGKVLARIDNGAVVLEPIELAVGRARALVRRYVPEGVSLANELIGERHDAADHE